MLKKPHNTYVEVYRDDALREGRLMPISMFRDEYLPELLRDPNVRCVVGGGQVHYIRGDLKRLPLIEVLQGGA